jgi:hypothetical protein
VFALKRIERSGSFWRVIPGARSPDGDSQEEKVKLQTRVFVYLFSIIDRDPEFLIPARNGFHAGGNAFIAV